MISLEIDTIFNCKSIGTNQNIIFVLMLFESKPDKTTLFVTFMQQLWVYPIQDYQLMVNPISVLA